MDTKCAPSKVYKDGSCFTLKSLKKIAESYNLKNPNSKISITDNKEKLVDELEKKLSNKCNEQTCWIRMDFVQALRDEEIDNNTFRPEGPGKKNEWLSTSDINNVVQQYQDKFKNFLFLGAVPADFEEIPVLGIKDLDFEDMVKNGKTKVGLVINLDEHWKSGSHWVALYTNLEKGQIYYFDSFAKKPYKRTRKFINRIMKYLYRNKYKKDIKINNVIKKLKGGNDNKVLSELEPFDVRYNTIQHQFNNSECGVYSINFVVRLVRGESFDDITQNITKDEEMNKCRGAYFRNVNT
jgi:hypothetical protein